MQNLMGTRLRKLTFLFMALTAVTSHASLFYVGTYTEGQTSKGIYQCDLNTETGRIWPIMLSGIAKNPSFLAIAPNKQMVVAASETSDGKINVFSIETDGGLTRLNEQSSGGADPCHVSVDHNQKYAFIANYSGGSVSVFPLITNNFELGDLKILSGHSGTGIRTDFVQLPDSGTRKPHAHAVYASEDDRFVYVCDLGTDKIWIYNFDQKNGKLTPAVVPFVELPAGSGPRHLAFHPNSNFVYVINEMACTVTAFERNPDNGALVSIQTVSALAEGTTHKKEFAAAAIVVHPNGRLLYASVRGLNAFEIYRIGPDGKLTWVAQTPTTVEQPRDFAIDPSGKWLVVAGQKENKIASFKIDPATGLLTATGQTASIGAPVCILFP